MEELEIACEHVLRMADGDAVKALHQKLGIWRNLGREPVLDWAELSLKLNRHAYLERTGRCSKPVENRPHPAGEPQQLVT